MSGEYTEVNQYPWVYHWMLGLHQAHLYSTRGSFDGVHFEYYSIGLLQAPREILQQVNSALRDTHRKQNPRAQPFMAVRTGHTHYNFGVKAAHFKELYQVWHEEMVLRKEALKALLHKRAYN